MKLQTKMTYLMVLATFFWGAAFIAAKLGVYALSPVLLTFLRMGIATLIFFPWMMSRLKGNWKIQKKEWPMVILTGLIGMVGYHMFFFTALQFTSASKASMINAANPVITALLAHYFVSEKLTRSKFKFLISAWIGVLIIIVSGNNINVVSDGLNRGDLIMLMGTLCWAFYGILVKRYLPRLGAIKLTAYTFLTSTLMTAPFAIYDLFTSSALNVGISPYIAVLYMAIFPTVIGYAIQQQSIVHLGASKTALFINLVPIVSTTLAVLFLGESVSMVQILGALMVLMSVWFFNKQ